MNTDGSCRCPRECPWDRGEAISDLDIPRWVRKFNYKLVPKATLEENAAIHELTTQGRQFGLGEWDLWIARDFKPYLDFVLVHETVENWLRRRGWKYAPSHHYAEHVEDELFLDDPLFSEYRKL